MKTKRYDPEKGGTKKLVKKGVSTGNATSMQAKHSQVGVEGRQCRSFSFVALRAHSSKDANQRASRDEMESWVSGRHEI